MKYVSIDLETTGLNPERHSILTFSAILEDTSEKLEFEKCPKLNIYIIRGEVTGSPFALNMNAKLLASIARYQTLKTAEEKKGLRESLECVFLMPEAVPFYLYLWCLVYHEGKKELEEYLDPEKWELSTENCIKHVSELKKKNGSITINVAGKNFGTFDKKFIDKIEKIYELVRFRQRILDPSVLFVDWHNDLAIPDLKQCKERAKIDGIVTHDSLFDAWDVVQLFRKFY